MGYNAIVYNDSAYNNVVEIHLRNKFLNYQSGDLAACISSDLQSWILTDSCKLPPPYCNANRQNIGIYLCSRTRYTYISQSIFSF